MNYNENKTEIKTLSNYIEEKMKITFKTLRSEDLKKEHINSVYMKELISLKKGLIPVDLVQEVESIVERNYQGSFEEYFKDIIYFDNFTLEKLNNCNILESKIYNENFSKNKGRKVLRRLRKPDLFHASVLLKLVGNGASDYCSKEIKREFLKNKKKEFDFVKNSSVINKDGKEIKLVDCVRTKEQSVAEKINIIKTIEKMAEDKGFTWCFITLTHLPEFHPNPTRGAFSYNGTSPIESNKEMNENIKRARSLMLKNGLKAGEDYFGCFSTEAHKDGCSHKHGLFFIAEKNIEELRRCFETHFPNLKGKEDSFKINNGKAKASSYIFKYVMKSLTHFDENFFESEIELSKEDENSILNSAFRSYNFIRGFSFFGIENCLSKFRYVARNLKEFNLPSLLEDLFKNNNLYELITGKYFELFENEYIEEEVQKIIHKPERRKVINGIEVIEKEEIIEITEKRRTFKGVSYNGQSYMKKFFQLVINANKEKIENAKEIISNKLKVIVNHNYSRNGQSPIEILFKSELKQKEEFNLMIIEEELKSNFWNLLKQEQNVFLNN